jgi:hypothetical protein
VGFLAVWAACTWLAHQHDVVAKTTVLFFNVEDDAGQRYQALCDAFAELSKCAGQWSIRAKGATADWKHQAGASHLVQRSSVAFKTDHRASRFIRTDFGRVVKQAFFGKNSSCEPCLSKCLVRGENCVVGNLTAQRRAESVQHKRACQKEHVGSASLQHPCVENHRDVHRRKGF